MQTHVALEGELRTSMAEAVRLHGGFMHMARAGCMQCHVHHET